LSSAHIKKSAGELRRQFLESAPFGLFTSLPYLHFDPTVSEFLTAYHFKAGLSCKRLSHAYGDYWLYGGDKSPSVFFLEDQKALEYQRITSKNLDSNHETFESLQLEKIRREKEDEMKRAGTFVRSKTSGQTKRKHREEYVEPRCEDGRKRRHRNQRGADRQPQKIFKN